MKKLYISPDDLLFKSYQLAQKVKNSDWKPNFIVALWRGGAPVGIAVQEYLEYFKILTDHISIRTSSYVNREQQTVVNVHSLNYIIEKANINDCLLIVDDIYDTGKSAKAVISELKSKMRLNCPDIRVATVFWKPEHSEAPDYYVEKTDAWVVFPHELDMTLGEIIFSKGEKYGEIFR